MKNYDLEERTLHFSIEIFALCRKLPKDYLTGHVALQLLRSATSLGANYREANGSTTSKDFKYKIILSRKEAKEAEYWLSILARENSEAAILKKEALELIKILSTIAKKANQPLKNLI